MSETKEEVTQRAIKNRLIRAMAKASDTAVKTAGSHGYIIDLVDAALAELESELNDLMKARHGGLVGALPARGPALVYISSDEPWAIAVLDRVDWNTYPLSEREEAIMEALLEHVDRQRDSRTEVR